MRRAAVRALSSVSQRTCRPSSSLNRPAVVANAAASSPRWPTIVDKRWYSEQATQQGCPTCHKPLPSTSAGSSPVVAHCPSCNAFLPPSGEIDYFRLFDLQPGFSISKPVLKRKFLEWQGKVHPDRLISGSTQQEDWAKTWSAIVNESYKTLNDDRLRGEYLLAKRGVEIEEQDKMEDPEMLMEILEVRESLEEAQTEEEISVIRDQNKALQKETLAALEASLAEESLDAPKAKALLIRLRYQQGVEDICREWQPGKDIVLQH